MYQDIVSREIYVINLIFFWYMLFWSPQDKCLSAFFFPLYLKFPVG